MNTNPLVAALKYAANGWRVVPLWEPKTDGTCTCPKGSNCSSPGKHPRLNNGHLGASTDPDQIRTWWRQWPNANIGLVTDGSVVIDFDPQHGGLDTLAVDQGARSRSGRCATQFHRRLSRGPRRTPEISPGRPSTEERHQHRPGR